MNRQKTCSAFERGQLVRWHSGLGLLLILAVSSASAQTLIGVNFIGQNNGGGIVTGTAGVMPQQDWNNPIAFARTPGTGGQTSTALNDSNGNLTPVTLTANMADSWVSGSGTSTQDLTLMNGILKVNSGNTNNTADLTYNNVPAGSYNIFVYCAEDATGSYGNLSTRRDQKFSSEPVEMAYDPTNRVLYAGNWGHAEVFAPPFG